MYIYEDNNRLNAVLDMPGGDPQKCPLVIIIHGYSGHTEEVQIAAIARKVNELGYASLRVDMYGHGKSDGEFRNHTLFKWMTNMMTVIDYARALPFVTDIYLCGHSQGGLTVMLAAALKHESISGMIALSPAVMIPELARKGEIRRITFDPDRIPDELVERNGRILSGNYIRAAQMIHVDEAIARYNGPVLLVHGDADESAPWHYSAEAARAYQNAKLVIIPGETHYYDNHLGMMLDAVAGWLPKVSG